MARFLDSPRVELVPETARTADCYALICSGWGRKGQPIPTNDLWIVAGPLHDDEGTGAVRLAWIPGVCSLPEPAVGYAFPWPAPLGRAKPGHTLARTRKGNASWV